MPIESADVGDVVAIPARNGAVGVVSRPITRDHPGHVLLFDGHYLGGVPAEVGDVEIADESCEGFAQLASNLIKLGSHVLEQRLIVYRR